MDFEATVSVSGEGNCFVPLPFDPKQAFGKARAPVVVTIDDHPAFRTTVAVYGGDAMIGLRKAQVTDFGLAAGDRVRVRVEPDAEPRTVETPRDLAAALAAAPDAAATYERLSYTHRREYVRWITEAKKQETRDRRVGRAVEMLQSGIRTPG